MAVFAKNSENYWCETMCNNFKQNENYARFEKKEYNCSEIPIHNFSLKFYL